VQTFLPYQDYIKSASSLDNLRLNKQTVEVKQIYNALTNPQAKGWKNHPATIMWAGYEVSLIIYGWQMCREWIERGFKTKLMNEFSDILVAHKASDVIHPPWLGDERVHSSHRMSLLSKKYDWYSQFNWPETDTVLNWYVGNSWSDPAPYEYFWPVQKKEKEENGN
jgi:hypothetical protein